MRRRPTRATERGVGAARSNSNSANNIGWAPPPQGDGKTAQWILGSRSVRRQVGDRIARGEEPRPGRKGTIGARDRLQATGLASPRSRANPGRAARCNGPPRHRRSRSDDERSVYPGRGREARLAETAIRAAAGDLVCVRWTASIRRCRLKSSGCSSRCVGGPGGASQKVLTGTVDAGRPSGAKCAAERGKAPLARPRRFLSRGEHQAQLGELSGFHG